MIRSLYMENFCAFRHSETSTDAVHFSPGLNVVVGPNDSGKTQLLKLIYCLAWMGARYQEKKRSATAARLEEKLKAVFKVDTVGRLASRRQGEQQVHVGAEFSGHSPDKAFGFSFSQRATVQLDTDESQQWFCEPESPIFLPTREVISLFPGFTSLYNKYELEVDETVYDLCQLLDFPPKRGPKLSDIQDIRNALLDGLQGRVVLKDGRFYLNREGEGSFEMHLVAEGLRKLSQLMHLLNTGVLDRQCMLLWDEPESNLNPRILGQVAKVLFLLSQLKDGAQVIVTTHSYYLLKELDLLRREALLKGESPEITFFSLTRDDGVSVQTAPDLTSLQQLVTLEAELLQIDREEALAIQERKANIRSRKGQS